jgi:hypothetical protein
MTEFLNRMEWIDFRHRRLLSSEVTAEVNDRAYGYGRRLSNQSPTMFGPSNKSSPSSGKPENVLVYVERLRQWAEEFHKTLEEELRTARALLEELHVRQAKRRGHGRRMD